MQHEDGPFGAAEGLQHHQQCHRRRFGTQDGVDAAHDAGLKAIAHAVTTREVTVALDAGIDGLAHVYADADETARRLADRIAAEGVFVVTTLAYFEAISQRTAADHMSPATAAKAAHAARMPREAGVALLATTAIVDVWRRGVRQTRQPALADTRQK
ncbi:hypothetical protein ACGF7U_15005 [Micromonospora sp. NPDC047670]|uniref:hypothetical protein n=1 Tax=Micromonospora sp. NPDC047670 TaxID=3364252 RepID=UPI00371E631B